MYNKAAKTGHLTPPPYDAKRHLILAYATIYGLHSFVETGTYFGDTIHALQGYFKNIYSIELDPDLFERAKQRFSELNHIEILQDDSGEILPEVLKKTNEPCLFWLDGHYSTVKTAIGKKVTPISKELKYVLAYGKHKHVVLIDDARLFTGIGDYPKLYQLRKQIISQWPEYQFDIKHDMICIYPSRVV